MTSIYTNTKSDCKVQTLIKQTETVTQRCNTDRTFFFFFLFDWGYVWASKPQRHD